MLPPIPCCQRSRGMWILSVACLLCSLGRFNNSRAYRVYTSQHCFRARWVAPCTCHVSNTIKILEVHLYVPPPGPSVSSRRLRLELKFDCRMPNMGVSGEVLGAAAIGSLVGAAAAAYHLLQTDRGTSVAPSTAPAPAPPACPGEGEHRTWHAGCATRRAIPFGIGIVNVALSTWHCQRGTGWPAPWTTASLKSLTTGGVDGNGVPPRERGGGSGGDCGGGGGGGGGVWLKVGERGIFLPSSALHHRRFPPLISDHVLSFRRALRCPVQLPHRQRCSPSCPTASRL